MSTLYLERLVSVEYVASCAEDEPFVTLVGQTYGGDVVTVVVPEHELRGAVEAIVHGFAGLVPEGTSFKATL